MNNKTSEILYDLLYESSEEKIVSYISNNTDSKMLHYIAYNYNWDNGFAVPCAIIKNKYCDLGTALMIFELAEGYMLFFEEQPEDFFEEHMRFVLDLKSRIENNDFKYSDLKYAPSLSRVEIFKLKKSSPDICNIFINGTDGEEIDIPVI